MVSQNEILDQVQRHFSEENLIKLEDEKNFSDDKIAKKIEKLKEKEKNKKRKSFRPHQR